MGAREVDEGSDVRVREREGEFISAALRAAERSYSPYSGFPVGACLVWEEPDGAKLRTSVGCNVENCFYQAVHAEQAAIIAGVSAGLRRLLGAYVACTVPGPDAPLQTLVPCGFCRQWMAEFVPGAGDAEVVIADRSGRVRGRFRLIADLLPHPFRLDQGTTEGKVE